MLCIYVWRIEREQWFCGAGLAGMLLVVYTNKCIILNLHNHSRYYCCDHIVAADGLGVCSRNSLMHMNTERTLAGWLADDDRAGATQKQQLRTRTRTHWLEESAVCVCVFWYDKLNIVWIGLQLFYYNYYWNCYEMTN